MNTETKFKKNIKKITTILLCLCVLISVVYIVKQFGILYKKNNTEKQNKLHILEYTIKHNEITIKKLQNDNTTLQNTAVSLSEKIELIQTELNSLKNYIYKLEQQNPINSEKNLQTMILLNKIQKLYYSNKNFTEELKHLKILTKNKPNLTELVDELEKYKISKNDIQNIAKVFKDEYKTNLLVIKSDKKQNIFKEILSNNIKIRKINVKTDNIDNKSVLIKKIEDAMVVGDFVNMGDLLKNSEYCENVFINTCEIIDRIVNFDKIVSELMDNIVINN